MASAPEPGRSWPWPAICASPPPKPGPRRRTALLRPRHDRRGRRALGLLQPAGRPRRPDRRGRGLGAADRVGPDLRQRHDQDPAQPGMEHGPRPGDRGRSPGPGHLYADERLRARLSCFRGQAPTGVRGRLTVSDSQTLLPPGWPRPKGYANGVAAAGRLVFVAGTIGWNQEEEIVSDDFAEQFRQVLVNTLAILGEANAGPEHITRMTWFVTDRDEYLSAQAAMGQAWKD